MQEAWISNAGRTETLEKMKWIKGKTICQTILLMHHSHDWISNDWYFILNFLKILAACDWRRPPYVIKVRWQGTMLEIGFGGWYMVGGGEGWSCLPGMEDGVNVPLSEKSALNCNSPYQCWQHAHFLYGECYLFAFIWYKV